MKDKYKEIGELDLIMQAITLAIDALYEIAESKHEGCIKAEHTIRKISEILGVKK